MCLIAGGPTTRTSLITRKGVSHAPEWHFGQVYALLLHSNCNRLPEIANCCTCPSLADIQLHLNDQQGSQQSDPHQSSTYHVSCTHIHFSPYKKYQNFKHFCCIFFYKSVLLCFLMYYLWNMFFKSYKEAQGENGRNKCYTYSMLLFAKMQVTQKVQQNTRKTPK